MRTKVVALITLALVALTAFTASASTPAPVRTSDNHEVAASKDGGWLAWSTDKGVTYVRHEGVRRRVRAKNGSRVGSIKLDGPFAGSLWYVRHYYGESNIARYDLQTHRSYPAPPGVNTHFPEFGVSASGDHLLFARESLRDLSRKIVLYRLSTRTKRVIAADRGDSYVRPGQVNGNFAVYARCVHLCSIFRYRISTHSTRRITGAIGSQALTFPAVLPDGTVYFVRGNNECGGGVKLKRWRHGKVSTILAFRDSVDVGRLEARMVNGAPMVLFIRIRYGCHQQDIYRIAG